MENRTIDASKQREVISVHRKDDQSKEIKDLVHDLGARGNAATDRYVVSFFASCASSLTLDTDMAVHLSCSTSKLNGAYVEK